MAHQRTKINMAGVAKGKELIGVPTDDDVSSEDRVNSLFKGSLSEDIYQVCIPDFVFFLQGLIFSHIVWFDSFRVIFC